MPSNDEKALWDAIVMQLIAIPEMLEVQQVTDWAEAIILARRKLFER